MIAKARTRFGSMSPLRLFPILAGGTAALTCGVIYWLRSRRPTAEQRERERRKRISVIGRITDGTVIDVQDLSANGSAGAQFLIYRYDVAGVSYEASQEVTYLRQLIDPKSCRLGLITSVKYDPHNPGNSIVIAEGWTGLRL